MYRGAGSVPPGSATDWSDDLKTKAGVPLFAYGNFITVAVNFVILAFIIFMMVQADELAQARRTARAAAPPAADAGRRSAAAPDPRQPEEVVYNLPAPPLW